MKRHAMVFDTGSEIIMSRVYIGAGHAYASLHGMLMSTPLRADRTFSRADADWRHVTSHSRSPVQQELRDACYALGIPADF